MPGSKLACRTSWMSSTILVTHKNTSFDHLKAKKSKFWTFSLPNPMARFFVRTGISLMMQKWFSYQPFRKWKWAALIYMYFQHIFSRFTKLGVILSHKNWEIWRFSSFFEKIVQKWCRIYTLLYIRILELVKDWSQGKLGYQRKVLQ